MRRANLEDYLTATARDGVQALIGELFALPTKSSADGPLALLPGPKTQLPRAKPLPKPKPPTKWEKFAAAKGIQKTRRELKVFDEERQEWVNRWGKDGKNKDKEEQWLTEVPANARAFVRSLVFSLLMQRLSLQLSTLTPQRRLAMIAKSA